MLGAAAVAMWWNIPAEMQAEFEDWHTHEHMPERLGIPGFVRGSRWIALSGEPSYFVLYETEHLDTVTGKPYLERLNNPTPWSQQMMPHHRNMVRSLCSVRASFGAGVSHAVATLRFSGALRSPSQELMAALAQGKGLSAIALLESQPAAATPQTTEQRIRGQDAVADRILLAWGYEADALKALLETELDLESHGARVEAVGLYRLAYCLSPGER